jgi:hypothetical protein
MPFGDYSIRATLQREGKSVDVHHYIVTSDYFKTLGLMMLRGREFTAAEETGVSGTLPIIIDKRLAERLFENENPIGQLLQMDGKPMLIVGVAPGVKHDVLESQAGPHLYSPASAADAPWIFLFARVAGSQRIDDVVTTVRAQLRAVDPNLPVIFVHGFRAHHESSVPVGS